MKPDKVVRYAVVGLGHFAQTTILPAFAHARNSRLIALFSGDDEKLAELRARYAVEHALHYDEYDDFLRSGAVDAVYIALPNSLHREYTVRAAEAGVHVLCEKPMATSSADCQAMIDACARADKKLMVAYRLHFEKANLEAIRIANDGTLGEVRSFVSTFCMQVRPGNIRTEGELGGGPLWDIGVYCVNAARYIFQAEPIEVRASIARHPEDERFREVEEQAGAVLRFPGERLASFLVSFNASQVSRYEVLGTQGRLVVDPAYGHSTDLKHELFVDGKTTRKTFRKSDQVAAELVHFSNCIASGADPEPTGIEGLCDVRVIEALLESARTRQAVALPPLERGRRPDPRQEHELPPSDEPQPVRAESPHP